MKKWIVLVVAVLCSVSAFAGDVQFIVTYPFDKNSPCVSPTDNSCVQDIIVYDTLTGTRRVNATLPAPPTANSSTQLTSSIVTLKDVYGAVTFYAVARARTATGALVESNPTSAPSVDLVPGAVVSLSVSVK